MKLSVSLTEADVRLLDELAEARGLSSRSAVVQEAVRELRLQTLGNDYREAFTEWAESEDHVLWDGVSGDGVADATR